MEVRPDQLNEKQFFPGISCINTAVLIPYMDANKYMEKKLDSSYTKMLQAILN